MLWEDNDLDLAGRPWPEASSWDQLIPMAGGTTSAVTHFVVAVRLFMPYPHDGHFRLGVCF